MLSFALNIHNYVGMNTIAIWFEFGHKTTIQGYLDTNS